jgi:hypothetical protein
MGSKFAKLLAIAALSHLLGGCTYAPTFEREGAPTIIGDGPELRPQAAIALVVSTTDPRFRWTLERGLGLNGSLVWVASAAESEYVAHVEVNRSATSSSENFVLCWPGFIVFAPAWHGLIWPYSVGSHVSIDRNGAGRVAEYDLMATWTARYTSSRNGALAELGWCFLVYTVPALQAGIESTFLPAEVRVLDRAFLTDEGDVWAEEVIATIVNAIARDRREHPPEPLDR